MGRRPTSEADLKFRDEVAEKFNAAMQQHHLNQSAAARELGVTRQAFSQYLLRKSTPQGEILARACALWEIRLTYRDNEFGPGAFAVKERKSEPQVRQQDLFKEPQVFVNPLGLVTIARTRKGDLQLTIKMAKATLPPRGKRSGRKAS